MCAYTHCATLVAHKHWPLWLINLGGGELDVAGLFCCLLFRVSPERIPCFFSPPEGMRQAIRRLQTLPSSSSLYTFVCVQQQSRLFLLLWEKRRSRERKSSEANWIVTNVERTSHKCERERELEKGPASVEGLTEKRTIKWRVLLQLRNQARRGNFGDRANNNSNNTCRHFVHPKEEESHDKSGLAQRGGPHTLSTVAGGEKE